MIDTSGIIFIVYKSFRISQTGFQLTKGNKKTLQNDNDKETLTIHVYR